MNSHVTRGQVDHVRVPAGRAHTSRDDGKTRSRPGPGRERAFETSSETDRRYSKEGGGAQDDVLFGRFTAFLFLVVEFLRQFDDLCFPIVGRAAGLEFPVAAHVNARFNRVLDHLRENGFELLAARDGDV